MKKSIAALYITLFFVLSGTTSISGQADDTLNIDTYRIFISNLEEHIEIAPDIHLTKGELQRVMGLRTEILNLLAGADSVQRISDEQFELLQVLNGEMIAIIWRETPSPMVELFDSEQEINYLLSTRNPVLPSWISP